MLKIGQLAARSGLSRDAIRFYEREGLLPRAPRTPSGYRLYAPETLTRLQFIKRAQALGFSLAEIRELLAGYQDPEECRRVKALLEQKIAELDRKLHDMQALRAVLARYHEACCQALATPQPPQPCPVLQLIHDAP